MGLKSEDSFSVVSPDFGTIERRGTLLVCEEDHLGLSLSWKLDSLHSLVGWVAKLAQNAKQYLPWTIA